MAIKGELHRRWGFWLVLALITVLATSTVLFCLGYAEGFLLKQVSVTLPSGQVVTSWPGAGDSSSGSSPQWSDWLLQVRGAMPQEKQGQLAFEALAPWHSLTFEYPWDSVVMDVRYNPSEGVYLVKEKSVVYRIADTALWFNQYLVVPETRALYQDSGPATLELRHQGPKGVLSKRLMPVAADWFYSDARRMPQRLMPNDIAASTGTSEDKTLASSESLMLQSLEAEQPTVHLLEADALQILDLEPAVKAEVEAYADAQRQKLIGSVPFEQASGHLTPMMRQGETFYRLTVTKAPGDSRIGDGYGRAVYDFNVVLELNPKVSGYWQPQSAGGLFTLVVDHVPSGAVPVLQQKLIPSVKWHTTSALTGKRFIALIPLGYDAKAGEYPFKISLSFAGGNHSRWQHTGSFKVTGRSFSIQRLTVDTAVEAQTRSDKAYAEYNQYFVPARDKSESRALWQGAFQQPIQGRITTQWGMKRSVNGALTTYRHNGIDLAAPEGTPVKASNSGKVVLARDLMLTGKSVIVDHGLGLFTAYLHLSTLEVKAGQSIDKGQVLGKVGSTGFSTGPHLHFSIYYHRTALDPQLLIQWGGALQ